MTTVCLGIISFVVGALASCLCYELKKRSKVHVIKRFCPYLQNARDTYNELSRHFDKNQTNFKLLSLKIKKVDDKCHMIVCKYKSLNDNVAFTI